MQFIIASVEKVVDIIIDQSMKRGEFDNLAGTGQPLPDKPLYHPLLDPTTRKLNEILKEGGFAPDWVMLQKDIK